MRLLAETEGIFTETAGGVRVNSSVAGSMRWTTRQGRTPGRIIGATATPATALWLPQGGRVRRIP
ncbi:hypothetical protein D3C83_195720 [compost metagenome]